MKGQAILIENTDQIEQGETMGLKIDPEYKLYDFYFDLTAVHGAYINPDGNIVCAMPDGPWILKYNEELWGMISEYLEFSR